MQGVLHLASIYHQLQLSITLFVIGVVTLPNFIRNRDQPTLGQWGFSRGIFNRGFVLLLLLFWSFLVFWVRNGPGRFQMTLSWVINTPRHPPVTSGPIPGEPFLFFWKTVKNHEASRGHKTVFFSAHSGSVRNLAGHLIDIRRSEGQG